MALVEKFSPEDFNAKIAYLTLWTVLNLSMQGAGFLVIDHAAKVAAHYRKLIFWKSYVARNQYDMFRTNKVYLWQRSLD